MNRSDRSASARLPPPLTLPLLTLGLLAAACGPSESGTTAPGDPTARTSSTPAACEPPQLALADGSCFRPGIPPDGCSEGFAHDGEYGCEPILPEDDCAPGMMAVPGDVACRPVMPCGVGKWGDLPVDADTQYVDGSYQGNDSDGSNDKPWATINDAYQAAAANDLIAVAEGRYPEQLLLAGKPIRIWGICPEKVSVVGIGTGSTIILNESTDGSEIGGIAITSAALGIGITGARNLTLDRLWLHDTALPAIGIEDNLGRARVDVKGCLIEGAREFGIIVTGGDADISASVIRGTLSHSTSKAFGIGLSAQQTCTESGCDPASRPNLAVSGCRIEGNHAQGVKVTGGDFTMQATVVSGTLPRQYDQKAGHGVLIAVACNRRNLCYRDQPTRATIEGSVIENNHTDGILVSGSQLMLETTVVRSTRPTALDQTGGAGIAIQGDCDGPTCGTMFGAQATVRASLVQDNHSAGIVGNGATLTVERTVARRTLPRQHDLSFGIGIMGQVACNSQLRCEPGVEASLTVTHSLVEESRLAGIVALGIAANLSSTLVRRTTSRQSDGLYGDGVSLSSEIAPTTAIIDALIIEDSARAGLSNFGADVSIGSTRIACAAFALTGAAFGSRSFSFEDRDDNVCGCPAPTDTCKAVSPDLEPPDLLP